MISVTKLTVRKHILPHKVDFVQKSLNHLSMTNGEASWVLPSSTKAPSKGKCVKPELGQTDPRGLLDCASGDQQFCSNEICYFRAKRPFTVSITVLISLTTFEERLLFKVKTKEFIKGHIQANVCFGF